jgi:plasmid stabilization system protein ParE
VGTNKFPVRLLSTAEQDLKDLLVFIAADNVSAAVAQGDRIEKKLGVLSTYPHLGTIPNDEKLTRLDYRVVVVDNYLIFYKILGKTVLVYRIGHGARDVPGLLTDIGQN